MSALEALWECLIFHDAATGFVSVSEREAREKILYARKAYEGLPAFMQRWVPIVNESSEELSLGERGRPSRLMSFAATASLRGRRMSVVLDEADFYRDGGDEAFRIGMGRATRGGRVTIGSTCFGVDTRLDRTMSGSGTNFSRGRFPWVVAENPEVLESIELARQELDPADFAEEYECVRGGPSDTFSPALIASSYHDDHPWELEDLSGDLVAGYDVGATRHPAILTVLRPISPGVWHQMLIHDVVTPGSDKPMSLPDQQAFLDDLLHRVTGIRLVIDAAGLGLQTTQYLQRKYGSARVIAMKAGTKPPGLPPMDKGEMTTEVRKALEASALRLLADKEQALQLKRTRRGAGGKVIQLGSERKSHYDRYWALAYALYGASIGSLRSVYESRGLIVIGGE